MKREWLIHFVAACTIALLLWQHVQSQRQPGSGVDYPKHPIEIVVPFAAGGGSDVFARIMERAINENELLPQPVFITNLPGGSGTIGSRHVKDAKPDGYKILCLHEGIITSWKSGTVPFGPDAFAAIAQTGNIAEVVVVRAESRWQNLDDLLTEAREQPGSLRFGTNIGAPSHFAGLVLEKASPGVRFNYVQSGGGQKRYTLLIGGHIELGVFSLAEFINFQGDEQTTPAHRLKALAVFSKERHPALPDVPSVSELGVDAASGNAQYWWAPQATPHARVERLAQAFEAAIQDPNVQTQLANLRIDPTFRTDAALDAYLDARIQSISSVAVEQRQDLPDFALITIVIVVALAATIATKEAFGRIANRPSHDATVPQPNTHAAISRVAAIGTLAILTTYVVTLQLGLGYAVATCGFVILVGAFILRGSSTRAVRTRWVIHLVEIGCITALGTQWVFSSLLSVPLP